MKIAKESYLFEMSSDIAGKVLATGRKNLVQKDTATIALKVVLAEMADELAKNDGKPDFDPADLLEKPEFQAWRIKVRDEILPLFTAAKNYQNVVMADNGLMEKCASGGESVELC